MPDPIITVENLSKRYLLGHRSDERYKYAALRDVIAHKTVDLLRGRRSIRDEVEEFWALRDISFDVKEGEVVGIIGRNGAGKSTLLKILSRITEPTEGRVVLRGRVSSLLEVGTGFHPELTGRENIFLNGAILGMKRSEIRKKFDEIVAFSEVERFLDTPVKRYSSGMYVRLAFAVAAHLEPEILLVDEVLAVGDVDFQRKCLGKMDEVSRREGRTVLFISHNLASIADLAKRGILLESGSIIKNGHIADAISLYLARDSSSTIYVAAPKTKVELPYIRRAEVITSQPNGIHEFGESLEVRLWIDHTKPMLKGCLSLNIINQFQHAVVQAWAFHPEYRYASQPGETLLICKFPSLKLNVGRYHIRAYLSEPPGMETYEIVDGACPFEVVRTRDTRLWGWDPSSFVYQEESNWAIESLSRDKRQS
jgi:lipopolysaccharide transport system ATP-binding protein